MCIFPSCRTLHNSSPVSSRAKHSTSGHITSTKTHSSARLDQVLLLMKERRRHPAFADLFCCGQVHIVITKVFNVEITVTEANLEFHSSRNNDRSERQWVWADWGDHYCRNVGMNHRSSCCSCICSATGRCGDNDSCERCNNFTDISSTINERVILETTKKQHCYENKAENIINLYFTAELQSNTQKVRNSSNPGTACLFYGFTKLHKLLDLRLHNCVTVTFTFCKGKKFKGELLYFWIEILSF